MAKCVLEVPETFAEIAAFAAMFSREPFSDEISMTTKHRFHVCRCLSIDSSSMGQPVRLRVCRGDDSQRWTREGGKIRHGAHENLCLTKSNESVLVDRCAGLDSQIWLTKD